MSLGETGAPFDERGGRLRGALDVLAGRYPRFLFGGDIGDRLPVFHFHETTRAELEPAFQYLAENGYRTVVSDDVAALVRDGRSPGPRAVMLAFDDAWASLWTVAAPLLRRFGLRAVTYAIPARLTDMPGLRATIDTDPAGAEAADAGPDPFVTWSELRALSASGIVDVQSHTWSHSMIFCGGVARDVVRPGFEREPRLNRPRTGDGTPLRFLEASQFGFPLFDRRSRMSDALRTHPDADTCAAVEAHVAMHGGAAFFERPNWRAALDPLLGLASGQRETEADQRAAIETELARGRDELSARLGAPVRHVCLPWGVSGRVTRDALERLGVATAFANRLAGQFAVARGDDPYFLKRLHSKHIFALPGRGRRPFATFA